MISKNIFYMLKKTYKNPCSIKGRSSRKEYTVFLLSYFIVFYCLYFLTLQEIHVVITILTFLFLLITAVVSFCLNIRRLHDINISGWWHLFYIIITSLIYFYFVGKDDGFSIRTKVIEYGSFALMEMFLIFTKGTQGANRYGEPPQH